jgi:biofilm PGA synthesis N-glycosyltransferase PgaC
VNLEDSGPQVSVITIVKDNPEGVALAIESTLAQAEIDFEHIIVNDGSEDETALTIGRYQKDHFPVRVIHLERNEGRAAARNRGLLAARGPYLLFLEMPMTASRRQR